MKNVASGLVSGVENIDRMKKEIRLVVGLVVNLLHTELFLLRDDYPRRALLLITNDAPQWKIRTIDGEWELICDNCIMRGFHHDGEEIGVRAVAKVYDSLPALVDGTVKMFPNLAVRLQPFLEVADREF